MKALQEAGAHEGNRIELFIPFSFVFRDATTSRHPRLFPAPLLLVHSANGPLDFGEEFMVGTPPCLLFGLETRGHIHLIACTYPVVIIQPIQSGMWMDHDVHDGRRGGNPWNAGKRGNLQSLSATNPDFCCIRMSTTPSCSIARTSLFQPQL
jgi:hypothetical protein